MIERQPLAFELLEPAAFLAGEPRTDPTAARRSLSSFGIRNA